MVIQALRKKKTNGRINTDVVKIFSALGDITRFKIFSILARKDEICVSEIAEEVGISAAGASQQLKVLEGAGVIVRQRMGQKVCYRVADTKDVRKIIGAINE